MQRTFSSQMTTELLISCILIRYKRTRWFYTLMGFVYFEQLYIYCPNSFLNYFSEPFEIIRQGGWIFKEAGRNENLKLIIYGLNFCCSWLKKKRFFRLLTVCSVCSLLLQRKFFFGHYLLFINVNRQSHIYMSKDFDDYNLIFHLPFSVGYLLCTILIIPCYYLIKRNKNYNGTHNVNSAHCNFIIELFMTLCKKNYWLWICLFF